MLYILRDPSLLDDLPSHVAEWVQVAFMLGRKLIISEWKESSPPHVNLWHTHLARLAALERLSYRLINRMESFNLKWERYLSNMKEPDEIWQPT